MFDWQTWINLGIAVVIALVAVLVLAVLVSLVMRLVSRRHPGIHQALAPTRRRFRALLAVTG